MLRGRLLTSPGWLGQPLSKVNVEIMKIIVETENHFQINFGEKDRYRNGTFHPSTQQVACVALNASNPHHHPLLPPPGDGLRPPDQGVLRHVDLGHHLHVVGDDSADHGEPGHIRPLCLGFPAHSTLPQHG